ncbi:TPA: HPr family phosphocarrier protein [Klebsiella quasipneumoniae]|nr:HPr family phosphocarrier protein [Klebsiella quasipneumoniae]HDE1091177.1 HPr family phosphocarrier protein [Klebsiella quasipneumoniae]
MPKFAANLSMLFTELPFLDRFAAAARAGFEAVEFLFPYEYAAGEIKQRLQENQLQLVLFNTPPGDVNAGEWGLAALPGRSAEARRDIELALEYACQLDCPQVHIMAGVVPPGMDRAACEAELVDNLRYAAECFARHDKRVLIEALNPQTKPGYLYHSQYQTLEIAQRVDRPNIAVQLDLFHAQKVDGNLSHLITEYAGQYRHIQIASLPDRHEPDEGEINYSWIYALLDKAGYDGWIGCEYIPRTDTLSGLEWFSPYRKK